MPRNDTVIQLPLIVIALLLSFLVLMMAVAWPMMGMWGWEAEPISGWTMLPMWLVSLVVFLGIGYLLYRGFVRSKAQSGDSGLEELCLAYARGDFTDEEFETRRAHLLDGEGFTQ